MSLQIGFGPVQEFGKVKKGSWAFATLGALLIGTGFCSHVIMLFMANMMNPAGSYWDDDYNKLMVPIPWMLAGFLCLLSRPGSTYKTRLMLFVMPFAILACGNCYLGYKIPVSAMAH